MKHKLFTLLFALMSTMSLMARGIGDGSSKENAIEYDWENGVFHYESEGTRWYRLDLEPLYYADSLRLSILNTSNTESVNVMCSDYILFPVEGVTISDSIKLSLAPQTTYEGWVLHREPWVSARITEMFFTVSSTGTVKLSWQAFFPTGESCEKAKYGLHYEQTAGTRWYKIDPTNGNQIDNLVGLAIHFENLDEDDQSNTISASFKTDCSSPEIYSRTFTLDAHNGDTAIFYSAELLASLGWPSLLLSCTSSSLCYIYPEYYYKSYDDGEACYSSIALDWEQGTDHPADKELWYAIRLMDLNPFPEGKNLRLHFENLSQEVNSAHAAFYFTCDEDLITEKNLSLPANGEYYVDMNRNFLEMAGLVVFFIKYQSDYNSRIWLELIPEQPHDTLFIDTTVNVCPDSYFEDKLGGLHLINIDTIWQDTISSAMYFDELTTTDTLITYVVYLLREPQLYPMEELNVLPTIEKGKTIDVSFANSALLTKFHNSYLSSVLPYERPMEVTDIMWQVQTKNGWQNMPYTVPNDADSVVMRYIVTTECGLELASSDFVFNLSISANILTIAEAIEIGMALDSMATSEETYTIEGYVINATAFNQTTRNQSWYMADDENASSSSFQAYTCYALEGTTKTAVTNGCKVRMTGNLHKYYNKASATYTVEMKKTPATILSLPQTETISVAQATAIGMALDSMATTIEFYTVEGYVINASTVNQTTHSQNWYMADDENDSSSSFQVYRGYTIEGTDTISVQNGYKVRVTSYLHKYYNQQTAKYVVEMLNTKATILSRPSIDTITVAQALEIGAELAINASTPKQYVIRGYISWVHIPFDSEYGNQSFYISDDSTAFAIYNANGGFYVYRGKPETGSALPEGTLVEFTCSIKNYNGQNIENAEQNIVIKVLKEAPECRDLKGSCGENVTWTLNTCEGHLIISGTGPTVSYSARSVSPFQYFNVQSVTIEEGVSGLGKYFFYGCTMPTITLPASLDSISVSALNRCPNLTSIEVADGNTHFSSVDGVLFSKDKTTLFRFPTGRAGEYVIPEGTVTIGYGAFNACYEVSSVIIPNTVTTLEEAAFYACQSINSIIIPEGVTSIGNVAFTHCSSLSSIIISSSVKHIGDGAFVNCTQLSSITNYAVVPQYLDPDGDSVFGGVSLDCKLYVPAESVDDYKAADVWKDFYNILPIQAEETETNTTVVTPGTNSADVVWPQVDGAYTYELVIKDKNGNVICTLVFNSIGQLIQIAFNAPARGDAPQKEQSVGFSFTVTGLSSGTAYELTLTAKDSNASTLDTQTLSFTTQSPQGIEETNDDVKATKFIRDGQVLILRGDKIYTVTGQEVK